MRTTLTIDDDVLVTARERAVREERTVGEVISELARTGLAAAVPSLPALTATRHGFRPLPRRGRAVSNALVDDLRNED